MACKNMTDALIEDVIEITWVFDRLQTSDNIKSWDEILDRIGSDGVKEVIKDIAKDFEAKYPFTTTWVDTNLDYVEEIEKFAEQRLIKEFGK